MLSEAMVNRVKSMGATSVLNEKLIVVITVPDKGDIVQEIDDVVREFYKLCKIKIIYSTIINVFAKKEALIIFYPERQSSSNLCSEVLSESHD